MQGTEGKLVLPSALEEIARVEETILQAVAHHGYGEQDRFAIQLALEEALVNAIKHGNRGDRGKRIMVAYEVGPEAVSIHVEDEGRGFRPDALPDPTLDENLEKPYGRGVMLMRVYMTEVRYSTEGNRVTMVKRRSHRGAGAC